MRQWTQQCPAVPPGFLPCSLHLSHLEYSLTILRDPVQILPLPGAFPDTAGRSESRRLGLRKDISCWEGLALHVALCSRAHGVTQAPPAVCPEDGRSGSFLCPPPPALSQGACGGRGSSAFIRPMAAQPSSTLCKHRTSHAQPPFLEPRRTSTNSFQFR